MSSLISNLNDLVGKELYIKSQVLNDLDIRVIRVLGFMGDFIQIEAPKVERMNNPRFVRIDEIKYFEVIQ